MAKNRVKIVGYAQRVFYNNGIEYRNFSDNLVGQQLTENGGTTLFTSGNFIVTTNMDPKISKMFKTNEFSDFVTLDSLDLTDNQIKLINETNRLKLNLNNSILTNYAYFGSLREFIRVSLEHIIINWPASIYVSSKLNGIDLTTIEDYTYNNITNISRFKTNTNYLNNSYNVKFLKNAIITDSYNNINDNKNLSVNYSEYTISGSTGEYNIIGYTGSTYSINDYIYFEVNGNPFSSSTQSAEFHIKPNNTKINEFFISLPDFEKYLLNRQTHPIYTSKFSYTVKTDTGIVLNTEKQLTWPVSDGYNIDFDTTKYITFVSDLVELADNNDLIQSDIINRSLVSNSISEFDTTSDSYDETEQKINKTLRIYGREFDEIKRFNDGLALANVVSYNKRDNAPDSILKGLARTLGWDLTSSLEENDFISSFLTTTQSTYSGQTTSLTKSEAEIEMWRRIILNTPWIWKSKGTRKAIEFFFKFIGAPNGLINFNEYLYIANNKLNMDEFVRVLEINTGSSDYSYLPIDSDGYPKVLPDNMDMYFQKGGLWYRQTGGAQSDLDILGGNNPHIGPYDGGYAYINQFRGLIPNFSSTTLSDEVIITGKTNLFYNYNNGIINGLMNTTVSGSCNVALDFDTILLDETQDCYDNNIGCLGDSQLNPDGTMCYTILTAETVGNISNIQVYYGDKSSDYCINGIKIYENATNKNFPLILDSNLLVETGSLTPLTFVNNTSSFWGNGVGTGTGRLNNAGVSNSSYDTYWKGFTYCLELDEEKVMYIGIAGDDFSELYVNGELILSFTSGGAGTIDRYKTWHVLPITFTAGKNIIEGVCKNFASNHAMGFELYNPSGATEVDRVTTLLNATTIVTAGLIWTARYEFGSFFDIGYEITKPCSDGYALDKCQIPEVCSKIIYSDIIDVDISECSFNVDWLTLLYLNDNLIYTSPTFYTSIDRLDAPTENDYINSLQSGATVLGLSVEVIGDNIIITKPNESYECSNGYDGGKFESKLKLNTHITSSQMTGDCESIIEVCDTLFKTTDKQTPLYIDSVNSSNTSSLYYDVTSSIISDPDPTNETSNCGCVLDTCDYSLKIDIKKKTPVYECEYISYVLDELDGCAIFTMSNGDTTKYVSSECCPSGYDAIDGDICETRCKKKPDPIVPPQPITCEDTIFYYNGYTIQTDMIAPIGWHIPTESEWLILDSFLINNGYNYDDTLVGAKYAITLAKNECFTPTVSPIPGNTTYPLKNNISGLSFRPVGLRVESASYLYDNRYATWMNENINSSFVGLTFNEPYGLQIGGGSSVNLGMVIRCIKDDGIEPNTSVIYDIDGNKYGWIKVGNQIWLDRDLSVTKLNDGTPIPLTQNNVDWSNLTSYGYSTRQL